MIRADLGDKLEAFVTRLVETGRYTSESEVLREGVRLIRDREASLATLDQSIAIGLAEAQTGQTKSAEEVFDRLERKYRALSGETE
ncbi:type II toxin-antitoxin system ParD family antitoxin [Methylobacterium sp. J-026]|uniref:type II toxin-antitoxin system ParD family antitoxin n=1 Tax=Methylobacterium sp. J-026 TaxID=2836624 RepID=UPI001FBBE356|nr:type II toxin-antitoxin system ParD family antitoxin [Methylobacterium sp. J-026]MCJ2132544.1 type II toxin-antitoxin system ParD family antitoxin [Methylobacterium sp. J-026]